MTSEEDFQRMLDANPHDHATRLVFADWLQDRGDPRAEGYRALGEMERSPCSVGETQQTTPCPFWSLLGFARQRRSRELPSLWLNALRVRGAGDICAPDWNKRKDATRRELEDAAALAWRRLSKRRRQQCRAELAEAVAV